MEKTRPGEGKRGNLPRVVSLLVGIAMSVSLLLFYDLEPGKPQVTRAAAVALLMAVWWISEAVPLAITSLLPVVLFPLLGVMDGKQVASQYFNHIIFLFLGGFIVALAMERWNLHKRIALRILLFFGNRPRGILLGFMVATAFLSMWISNTAATMMMVAIVWAIILKLEESLGRQPMHRFSVGLLLGVAYAASIGGIATLVGTPPNMSFTRIFEIQFPQAPAISFAAWFAFAVPISVIFLALTWSYLSVFCVPRVEGLVIDKSVLRKQYDELGPPSFAEWVVLADFGLLVLLWLSRASVTIGSITIPGWSTWFPYPEYINDGTVAVALAVVLFVIPAKSTSASRIMDWPTAVKLPWDIVLLFGGGFALASGFVNSGLSLWLGEQLQGASFLHPVLLLAVICMSITFLTELTSNTATTEMILPVLAGLAMAIEVNPLLLMIPATLSCSCAFMLPVATPPNAIVFGTGRLHIVEMAKVGLVLNFVGAVLIITAVYFLGPLVWGIDLHQMPAWAMPQSP